MNKAQSIDKAPVRGIFSMVVRDREGNVVDEYEDRNMIVNGAKMVMAQLISEAVPVQEIIGGGESEAPAGEAEEGTEDSEAVETAEVVTGTAIKDTVAARKVVTKIAFGEGTATAEPTDTKLNTEGQIVVKYLDGHEFPSDNADRVQFNWSLGYGEANGVAITEFGLLCNDDTLFAHKVRNPISKDDTLSFEGTWTIIF